ncbi:MAG: hypothetical protein ABI843_02410 [Dokdonella sp.]
MLDDLFDRQLTPELVLDVLADHVGAANALTARELVTCICGVTTANGERRLRTVVEALRCAGHKVAAHPSTGYFLAETADELNTTCEFLFSRAMTSLRQVAAMKGAALPDLRGQLRLPLTNEAPDEHAQ